MTRDEKKMTITIGKDGSAEIDVEGFDGRACVRATKSVEEAIGEVENREKKPAYHRRGNRRNRRRHEEDQA